VATDLFDFAGERLEHHTSLDRLEARGTLRIALKIAGLTANSVTVAQLRVVFEQVIPSELEARGVSDAVAACRAIIDDLVNARAFGEAALATGPDEIFRRLAQG